MDYKSQLKLIRPYVSLRINLNKKLSKNEKTQITRYFNLLNPLISDFTELKKYQPRNKDNLKIAAQYNGISLKGFPKIKAIPFNAPASARIVIKKGKLSIKLKNGRLMAYEPFDSIDLMLDTPKEVKRCFDALKEDLPGATHFKIHNGNNIITQTFRDYDDILDRIDDLMEMYDNAEEWLRGLSAYKLGAQASAKEFFQHLAEEKQKARSKKNRALRKMDKEVF